jgi:Tfp pilus assembly protein PilN
LKTISLLPPELKSRRSAQSRQNTVLVGVTVLVVLVVLAYGALFVTSIFLRSDLKALQAQREAVELEAAALEEYAVLHQELVAAEALVGKAMGTVPPWGSLLQEIGLILPTGVWLSEVTAKYADSSGELTMRGWAYEHDDVAAMLEQIYSLDKLDDIRCRVSTETVYGGQPVVQFIVNALVETGPAFITIAEGGS